MVIVLDAKAAVTPDGNPVAVPIPVEPVVLCVIAVKAVLMHNRRDRNRHGYWIASRRNRSFCIQHDYH